MLIRLLKNQRGEEEKEGRSSYADGNVSSPQFAKGGGQEDAVVSA